MKYGLGAVENPKDLRDFLLANYLPRGVSLPAKFSLRDKMTVIKDQGTAGTCTAFGFSAIQEYYNNIEHNTVLDLSEQWLYTSTKAIDGYDGEGSYPRAVAQALQTVGVCEEEFWPYEGRYPALKPAKPGAPENAMQYRIKSYATVSNSLQSIKEAIYLNGPVAVSMKIYENFMRTGPDGIVAYPAGSMLGGHLVAAIGYDGDKLEIRNSWGSGWGQEGYCFIPDRVWTTIRMDSAMSVVDLTNVNLPWKDWPYEEAEIGFKVRHSGILEGYPNGNFYPYATLKRRHVYIIAKRMGIALDSKLNKDYNDATIGWVKEQMPNLKWEEANLAEPISRLHMARLVSSTI
jgi:hypothetical protein